MQTTRSATNYNFQGCVRSKNRCAERFLYFQNFADRISDRGKSHGLLRSGYPPLQISRVTTERVSSLEHVTERSGFFRMCVGADIHLRGKSRIFMERISAATNVTDSDIRRTFFSTERFISLRRTNRTKPRHFPTVHRSNYPLK